MTVSQDKGPKEGFSGIEASHLQDGPQVSYRVKLLLGIELLQEGTLVGEELHEGPLQEHPGPEHAILEAGEGNAIVGT